MLDITPAIISAFRLDFDGFEDVTAWPDAKVQRVLERADRETGSTRWGAYSDHSIKQRGMFNFAAHTLIMKKAESTATTAGGAPSAIGQVQSKSVGDESVSYAVNQRSADLGDGALSATSYGQEFIRLRRRVAAGGSSSNAARGFPC